MTWPWHVLWWMYVVALVGHGGLLLMHTPRPAAKAEELIGPRIITIAWTGFILWFLATYAPPWAAP